MDNNYCKQRLHHELGLSNDSIYLDYNATTPLDPEVRRAIKGSIDEDWANPSSGKYKPYSLHSYKTVR